RIRHTRRLRHADPAGEPARTGGEIMSGLIGGLGVADILQVAALLRNGPVVVQLGHEGSDSASVWLDGTRVVHAQVGALAGRAAFLRLLEWQDGTFRVEEKAWNGEP